MNPLLRSLLIIVLIGLFPSSLLSQDGSSDPEADSSEQPSFSNEVGLGLHSLSPVGRLIVDDPSPGFIRWRLQGTYKRELKHFSLRAGIGGGSTYLYRTGSPDQKEGWQNERLLISNAGIEKAIWKPGGFYELNIALDLVHYYRYYNTELFPKTSLNAYGVGLSWGNQFFLSERSSISLELGLFYGWWKSRRGWVSDEEWGFGGYRNFLLSYHYHFK